MLDGSPLLLYSRGMVIKFERCERDCPHNDAIRKAGETRGIIYDFKVIIDGVFRAKWVKDFGTGYELKDAAPDFEDCFYIRHPLGADKNPRAKVRAKKKDEFLGLVQLAIPNIPTPVMLEARKAERLRKEAEKVIADAESSRQNRMKSKAGDMYEILFNLYKNGAISGLGKDIIEYVEEHPAPEQTRIAP